MNRSDWHRVCKWKLLGGRRVTTTVMRQELSIHDNFVYAYTVNCEGRRVVLHTAYRDGEPNEYTDVVFRDVVAHHLDHVLAENILFDIEESDIASLVQANKDLFAESWQYGWPPINYNGDLNKLVEALRAGSIRAFTIGSSYGLSGWVLASSCELVSRPDSANVV